MKKKSANFFKNILERSNNSEAIVLESLEP